jgi:hypothetical protein
MKIKPQKNKSNKQCPVDVAKEYTFDVEFNLAELMILRNILEYIDDRFLGSENAEREKLQSIGLDMFYQIDGMINDLLDDTKLSQVYNDVAPFTDSVMIVEDFIVF